MAVLLSARLTASGPSSRTSRGRVAMRIRAPEKIAVSTFAIASFLALNAALRFMAPCHCASTL